MYLEYLILKLTKHINNQYIALNVIIIKIHILYSTVQWCIIAKARYLAIKFSHMT